MARPQQPTPAAEADQLLNARAEIRRLTVMLDCYGEILGNTIEAQVEHMTAAKLNAERVQATQRVIEAMRERGKEPANPVETADERLTKECERLRELATSEERERQAMERELNKAHAEIERLRAELPSRNQGRMVMDSAPPPAPKKRAKRTKKNADTPKT